MSDPAAPIALTTHIVLLSSISFGGFPSVLPDVRNFVVFVHPWMTDREFANFFALAHAIPGPNMILMMLVEGVGHSWRDRERSCDLWPTVRYILRCPSHMEPAAGLMAAHRPRQAGSGDCGTGHRWWYRHGKRGGHRIECRDRNHRGGLAYAHHKTDAHSNARCRRSSWCARAALMDADPRDGRSAGVFDRD
jgi:Chromate transporter